ncbi:hypothetical protein BKA04_002060 [Cryobacterium mesophilum]|nr:mannosyltransferase family protein [Terrimesophilobacter mesophilus]MBB5633837.1 hypothetical protein [Terrimesophilobacter mesophilus]
MVDGSLSRTNQPSLSRQPLGKAIRIRYRMTPWWLRVAVVWLVSRAVTTGILLWFAARQGDNAWTRAHPDYLSFAQLWDGTWYHIVADSGYPSVLPMTADGHVAENAWAFMPAYPFLVRGLMVATGLPWELLSVFVSLVFSLGAALVFYRMLRMVLHGETALFAVVLFCVGPLSPILQVSYAESMHVFLLAVALYLLMRRSYVLLVPVIAVMALTRPSGLAFALALGLHVIHRLVSKRRDPFPVWERILAVGVAVFSGLMGLLWPFVAWMVTGSMTAYTDTELAWRVPYLGYRELVPFTPWVQGAEFWMPGLLGIVVVVVVVVAFFSFLFTPWARRLGVTLRLWIASYGIYLLAVFFPQSSTFRLLLPMFPLAGALAQPRSRWYRVLLVALLIAGQWVWCYYCWWVDGYDWTPP